VVEVLESLPSSADIPTSAVRDLRERAARASPTAYEAEISQGHLSLIESGAKPLTRAVALKVARRSGVPRRA
jgi:hypothetical protein